MKEKETLIDRPPRIQPELPSDEIEIPAPPDKREEGYSRLIQISLPLLTIIGYVLVSTLGRGGRSIWMLIPMGLSVVASVAYALYSYFREKQRRAEVERAYENRLVELNKDMHIHHDMQRRFYQYNYPDSFTTLRTVHTAREEAEKTERALRSDTRLWERRVSDEDFGVVRLGMGTLPSTVTYVAKHAEDFEDPLVRAALKLDHDSRYVTDIPVIISFRAPPEEDKELDSGEDEETKLDKPSRIPFTHALGIAGDAQDEVYEFVRALLTHYVVFHASMDARLFILANKKQAWEWTEHLPHSQDDEQCRFRCFVSEVKQGKDENPFDDSEGNEPEQFLEGIRKILAQRKIRLQEREQDEGQEDPTRPFLLIVVDLLDTIYDPTSPLHTIEADAAISILLEEGAMLGAAVIFLVPERSKVPGGCRSVIEIQKTTPATNSKVEQGHKRLHFRYAETGVNTSRYVGEADSIARQEDLNSMAQELALLKIRQSFGANLATAVSFLDLMGYTSLDELKQETWKHWQSSTEPTYANWLRVKLGKMSGNKPRTLVFSARRDGVHGLVAGSTGSGKSELLISLIIGMAITYDPSVLNFVLVDFKGGGAFQPFGKLPHCVDIITNLAHDGVTRMFTAIQAEMNRRQKLNTNTGTKNIVDYRQRGLHQTHYPYPYLFIIIDEFAEMIADRSEFKGQLESITRLGRAQGVSLILAAQRPSGVTDQMRANIKFRICLRVETAGESREMLRRTDASYLPTGIPGRGYLQVGNEDIELIQVAYSGEKYVDPNQSPTAKVIWPDRGGGYDDSQDHEPPELYKAIIDVLNTMARDNRLDKQHAPWPEFLPTHISLSETLVSQDPTVKAITSDKYLVDVDKIMLGQEREATISLNLSITRWLTGVNGWVEPLDWKNYAMQPVVGLIDNPYAAQQLPLIIDLPRGHAVVFGSSGWGKTTFIRTLIVSLATTHSPDTFHAYILDLGGRNLNVLANLPHVGAMVIPDEEGYKERVEQLLRVIDDIIQRRKTLLSNTGLADIYEYNRANPTSPQPAILLAIDNFVEFVETFGTTDDQTESVLDKLITLARQSRPYGIHLIISANQIGNLSNQVYSLFTEHFTLKLADPTEYRAIVGGQVPDISDIPGRGYTKIGRQPLGFQVALPIDLQRPGAEPANEVKELELLAQTINDYIAQSGQTYNLPIRVDALPRSVLFKQLLARQNSLELDTTFLERFKAITRKKWTKSTDPSHADWLNVIIGVVSGNRARPFHLEAKRDGVHGMIAGGTGSGKSELLMTMIVGLALNYDPTILNFVLVDYKGGGAFKPFDKLPHCVDSITNLNKAAVQRMFTSIRAEMERRQKLNADSGVSDIVEYRKKGLHLDPKWGAYPHLFIIIDEYAEMITDSPEFREELDSITRVGRSVGVNLLLASQRPVGVSDQMRANIKLRICLRVEGVDTSREMLRRSDAAFLPGGMPGRGYVQVGNENIELIQVAYTGETYEHTQATESGEKPKFYDVMITLANELLQEGKGQRPRTPWPPFLPTALTMADPLIERYLSHAALPLITLNDRANHLSLNPFLQEWLDGNGTWHGIDWSHTAMRAIAGLLDNPHRAHQLPLEVNFTSGHAVLFGASGWGKTTFLRSLIVSLAGTHSPDEFHAHILDLGGRNLEVLQALPHVGTIIMPDERGYEERVQQLWRKLNELLDERKRRFSEAGVSTLYEYNNQRPDQRQPAILIAIDNFAEYIESFGKAAGKNDADDLLEAFVALARQGKAYGLHVVITVSRLNVLSSKLYSLFTERMTLRLAGSDDYSAIVGSKIAEIEEIVGRGCKKVGRFPLFFQIALPPGTVVEQGQVRGEADQIRALGKQMNNYITRSSHRYQKPIRMNALPKSSSYRQVLAELFAINQDEELFLGELRTATRQRWEHTASAKHASWLQVTLGITSGNQLRTLEFEAKKDGVHGMIAGGTGSGKSELLMTMIVGLALNYSPDILNFVLVDYKGGGAFKPFERLPHCVDIVTNLDQSAVHRMFTSINAEIRRRQALNASTGTKDIVDYRRKGLHKIHRPYPHLFIIIDEYAEMISDNDEFRPELESITRVGRAQGITLILASQRPKGVTDQMRANIKLRICLRVEEMDTSRELLRRPDAALLPNGMPGRGYVQVGNENLELIQVSYTGENQTEQHNATVIWPEHTREASPSADEDTPKLFDAVVNLSSRLYGDKMAPKPWPGFLPRYFSLQTPLIDAQHNTTFILEPAISDWLNGDTDEMWKEVDWRSTALRPVVGLVDDPAQAQQEPLRFSLSRSHLIVFGDSGFGKTTLLRTIAVSLAATHSPNDCHIYVLDLGGRNLRSLESLPHVGDVIYADEGAFEERLQRLIEKLNRAMEERQQLLSSDGSSTLYEYNVRHPDQSLPAIVVMIDNFAELQEGYETLIETTVLPIVRHSISTGITFVVSANVPGNMASKLYSMFGERVTFKQVNSDRYMDIVGRVKVEIDDIPGRGYIRSGKSPLLFHVAQPVGIFDEDGHDTLVEIEELRLMSHHMDDYLERKKIWRAKPEPIKILPEIVPLHHMLAEAPPANRARVQAVVGQDGRLQPALFDLERMGPHFSIVGPPLSGKTTTLYTWIVSLTERYAPSDVRLVLIDMQRKLIEYGGKHRLDEIPHVLMAVSELEQLESLLENLKKECETLVSQDATHHLFVFIDNFDDFSDEVENNRSLPRELLNLPRELAGLVRKHGRDGLHMIISGGVEGGASDLRRRVQSSNFGIGLRTEQAVQALRVLRTPAGVRGKELPVGRGYIVKSGQPTMIQVATPYESNGLAKVIGDSDDEQERMALALDYWVENVMSKYPDQQAQWSSGATRGVAPATGTALSRQSKNLEQGMRIIYQEAQQEVSLLKEGDGANSTLLEKLFEPDVGKWNDENTVVALLREIWRKKQIAQGMSKEIIEMQATAMDIESLLMALQDSSE